MQARAHDCYYKRRSVLQQAGCSHATQLSTAYNYPHPCPHPCPHPQTHTRNCAHHNCTCIAAELALRAKMYHRASGFLIKNAIEGMSWLEPTAPMKLMAVEKVVVYMTCRSKSSREAISFLCVKSRRSKIFLRFSGSKRRQSTHHKISPLSAAVYFTYISGMQACKCHCCNN